MVGNTDFSARFQDIVFARLYRWGGNFVKVKLVMKKHERVQVKIFEGDKPAAEVAAQRIAELIRSNSRQNKQTVLGLTAGKSSVHIYLKLIQMHQKEGLDFTNVITFNTDEYYPISVKAIQSCHQWMHDNFFDSINIRPENIHILSGQTAENELDTYCREYEKKIAEVGGIDLQVLSIGGGGHIGFNSPDSIRNSATRSIRLDVITRKSAASDFFGEEHVPEMGITMGVGTLLKAREIFVLAFGEGKSSAVKRAVEEEVAANVAVSYLQEHPNITFYLDEASAAELTRMKTPWQVGPCQWDKILKRQAVIWLAQKLKKPILKLTDEDYGENGLAELLKVCGSSYQLNIEVFRRQMSTITGWPGGKKTRRILIFSPHPDDDVISMGGTMTRLAEQGHEVHVAYMVSGYLSVHDHTVSRYADFVREFNRIFNLTPEQSIAIEQHIDKFLLQKNPGDIDSAEIQSIKGLIRRTEAIDAAKYCGVQEKHLHFLDMSFYNTGKVQKLLLSEQDITAVSKLIEKVKPNMIFAAGDLSDPHGTHRLCLDAILTAWQQNESKDKPEMWLYRGAWQEWHPDQIDMAVPLSPDEQKHKRYSIFRHESQKDRAMFPGPYDSREFWQRAEDRNMMTAKIFDNLGLPEYHALEAFVQYPMTISEHLKAQLTTSK